MSRKAAVRRLRTGAPDGAPPAREASPALARKRGVLPPPAGEANPNKEDLEKVTAKATLVAAAKAVQAYCDAVYAAQTDASLSEMITLGQQQGPRGQALIGVISHNMNEYGQMVILMRHKGEPAPVGRQDRPTVPTRRISGSSSPPRT